MSERLEGRTLAWTTTNANILNVSTAEARNSIFTKEVPMSSKGHEGYIYEFCDASHANELLDALREFYTCGLFTDIALSCAPGQGGGSPGLKVYRCHKAALSARSSYFRVMFTVDMRERSDDVIHLPGVDADVLDALVTYVYTSRVTITQSNVQSLLEAADLLQFIAVKRACEEFLIRHLDVDNCLGMHSFAELHVCESLEREARRVMLSRFQELVLQEEFLEADLEKLTVVMAAENLNVWREELLLEAVVRWVAHDPARRLQHTQELLRCIHLELDEMRFERHHTLSNAPQTPLPPDRAWEQGDSGDEEKLRALILHSLKPSSSSSTGKELSLGGGKELSLGSGKELSLGGSKELSLGCCGKKLASSMCVVGGYYWHPLFEVHLWNPASDTWVQGKDMPDYGRESYSVALLGPRVYVTGGYRTETIEALDTVWIYDADGDEWAEGCPMVTARYYHCSVAMRGCVYAVGGYRGGAPAREMEFYDPLKKEWFPVADMIQGVGNATACVLNDRIYVTGGHYGYRGTCTYEKIQVYRPDTNQWSIATICPHPEYGLCSVAMENKLYLVGGQTTVTDCWDPERDEWRQLAAMKERRMEGGATVINGCIYVTGGYSYSKGTYLQSIEKYDPELDSWELVGHLPSPTRSHGCVCFYSI